jgi:indolepyruvate ferredoxin oxidoreductase beta subunit
LLAFERLEALRYAHFLKKNGVLVVNDCRIDPMTVTVGAAEYPDDILQKLQNGHTVYAINGNKVAEEIGNNKVLNSVVLGLAAQHMEFSKEQWLEVLSSTVPPKTLDMNKAAFEAGYESK